MARQRFAVQRVGEERLGRQRLLARERSAELLLDLELLLSELHFLFAVVGAEKDELRAPAFTPASDRTARSGTPVQRPLPESP